MIVSLGVGLILLLMALQLLLEVFLNVLLAFL